MYSILVANGLRCSARRAGARRPAGADRPGRRRRTRGHLVLRHSWNSSDHSPCIAGPAPPPNPGKRASRRRRSRAYHCCRARSLVRRLLVASIIVNSAVDAAASAEGRARPASARLSAVNNVQEAVGPALPPRDPIAPVSASQPTLFLGGTGGQQI